MARMAALISSIRGISTVGVHILSTGDGLIRVALNHQVPRYVSRLPDPSASAVDAFQQD